MEGLPKGGSGKGLRVVGEAVARRLGKALLLVGKTA